MNIRKLSILIGSMLIMAASLFSCDDKEKAKLQEAMHADLMQKMTDEINKYPELDSVAVESIAPFDEKNISKNGDVYTAKTTATLAYTYNDSYRKFVPKLKQINKTIDITVTGTKDELLSGNYKWTADTQDYYTVKKALSAIACHNFLKPNAFSDESNVFCYDLMDKLSHTMTVHTNMDHFLSECENNYMMTYYEPCIDHINANLLDDAFDESKYRFYEICYLLSSDEDYTELVDNMVNHQMIKEEYNSFETKDLYRKFENSSEIQPRNYDTNCQTFCQTLENSEFNSKSAIEQCNALCTNTCDQLCGKVHKNYAGADDATLTIFAYMNYLNTESTSTITRITDKLLEDYGNNVAIYFASNPETLNGTSIHINSLEEYANINHFGYDMHKFFVKYSPMLSDLEFDEIQTYKNDFPIQALELSDYDFDFYDLDNIKQLDEANHADLHSIADEMGIRGITPVLVINDKTIPVNQATTYESVKVVVDQELEKSLALSKQTGLKGVPLSNHIRSKMNPATIGKKEVEFELTLAEEDLPIFIETGVAPTIGDKNAPVTIITFSEFQCKYCEIGNKTLMDLYHNYPKDIRIVYKHGPLKESTHPYAISAALAAVAAQNQNKFWPYADKLYGLVNQADEDDIEKEVFIERTIALAEELGMNKTKFINDMNHPDTLKRVLKERDMLYQTLNGRGVPTYYINGQKLVGSKSYEQFETTFLLELDKTKKLKSKAKGEALYKAIVNDATSKDNKKRITIDTSNDIHIGNPNAPVTIVHFLDIQDIGGRMTTYSHSKLYLNNGGMQHQVIYKPTHHFDEQSMFYSSLLIAASKQNFFLEMADFIVHKFVEFHPYSDPDIDIDEALKLTLKFVQESGRDEQKFLQDYNADETKNQIKQNTIDYNRLECHGQYTCFIVQDKVVPENDLDDALKEAYNQLKLNSNLSGK